MSENLTTKEIKQLESLALTMPKWDDFVVEEFRKNPEWAKYRVASELEEYALTGEITCLLSTLKKVAIAKGWTQLAKESGLGRTTLYQTLNGNNRPRVDTLSKILAALGFKMLFVASDSTKFQTYDPAKPQHQNTRKKESAIPQIAG